MNSGGAPGWLFGTLRGTPIYIGRTWPIIGLVIVITFGPQIRNSYPDLGAQAYFVALLYALLLLLSVLAHEAAHALVGQWRGYRVRQIVADLWGGHTAYDTDDTSPLSSALVAVVGPLANGVLALVGWGLLGVVDGDVPRLLLYAFVISNTFVAIFNLLPGMPLDGGFLVDALVWRITGSRSAGMLVAGWCGRVVAALVVLWAIAWPLLRGNEPDTFYVLWSVLIAGFLWMGASNAIARGHSSRLFARVRVRDVLRPVAVVPDQVQLAQLPPGVDLAVIDARGAAWGFIPATQVAQAPAATAAAITAQSLAQVQPAGWVAQVDSPDADVTELVRAAQQAAPGIQELLVVADGRPIGLVSIEQLGNALGAAEKRKSAQA
ncbi:site-2 protease family protein [Flexivirga meconopsidis]|uniref:site-2 protease family protein n=1 Tax=Flexivirga meconopsidis TaxID=2977121 RepID=UPI0022406D17|nr:site-2 protease family protein [Flexivirga meconopsidis]